MADRVPAHLSFDWRDLEADLNRLLCWADAVGAEGVEIRDVVTVTTSGSPPVQRIASGRAVPEGAVEALAAKVGVVATETANQFLLDFLRDIKKDKVWEGAKLRQSRHSPYYDAIRPDDGSFVFYEAATGRRDSRWRVLFSAPGDRIELRSLVFVRPRPEDAPPRREARRG